MKEEIKEEKTKNCSCDCNSDCRKCKKKWKHYHHGGGSPGMFYGLGFVGALFYFLQHVSTFQAGVIGALKALVWPAFVVYKVLILLRI